MLESSLSKWLCFRTENTAMIAGLGQASKLVTENIDKYNRHMEKVRDYLEDRLKVRHEIYSS